MLLFVIRNNDNLVKRSIDKWLSKKTQMQAVYLLFDFGVPRVHYYNN